MIIYIYTRSFGGKPRDIIYKSCTGVIAHWPWSKAIARTTLYLFVCFSGCFCDLRRTNNWCGNTARIRSVIITNPFWWNRGNACSSRSMFISRSSRAKCFPNPSGVRRTKQQSINKLNQ